MKLLTARMTVAVLALGIALFMSGCSPKVTIRASDTLFSENPIQKVALIAEGKVNWPRMGKGGAVLRVTDGKTAVEGLLAQTKKVLSDKGYEVVYAEPAGIGYNCKNWWLWNEEANADGKAELSKIESVEPLFVYPACAEDSPFSRAVQKVIRELETSLSNKKLDQYAPPKEDLLIIGEQTGADTVCLNRVYGQKYSAGRKAGTLLLGALLAPGAAGVNDMTESYVVMMRVETGEVLWQHGLYIQNDPLAPQDDFMGQVLGFLPPRGRAFDQKACKRATGEFVQCK